MEQVGVNGAVIVFCVVFVHPVTPSVTVKVYTPALRFDMLDVVAPLLHTNVGLAALVVVDKLPFGVVQLVFCVTILTLNVGGVVDVVTTA